MGWLIEGLVTVCTASLIVGSNGAVDNGQNAGSSEMHDANRRFSVIPRQVLAFYNNTRVSETSSDTSRMSATHIDSVVFTSTETESSATSTSREHAFPSTPSPSESIPSIPSRTSSNAPSTSSAPYSSGAILQSVTKGANTLSITSLPTVISSPTPEVEYMSSTVSEIRLSSTQLPATTTDLFHIVWDSLSQTSSSSRAVNVAVTSATTSCTSSTLSSTPPRLPTSSRSTTRLPSHTVSDLVNWLPPISSKIDTNNDKSSPSATAKASAPTITIPQETASLSSETSGNFFPLPTAVAQNASTLSLPSTISSEASVVNTDWIPLVFTRPNSQTLAPTSSLLPGRLTISVSSNLFSNSNFSGSVPSASLAVPTRSVVSDIPSPTNMPFPENNTFSSSGISSTSVFSTGSLLSRIESSTYIQTTRASLQPSSMSKPFTHNSLIPTPTQSSTSTTVTKTSSGQLSSMIISSLRLATTSGTDATSSLALLPFPVISSVFTGSRNASVSRTAQSSHPFTNPIFPTSMRSSSSTITARSSHMSGVSSLHISSISRSAVPSASVTPSSFVTKTKTQNFQSPSNMMSGTEDIKETMKGQSTALPPTNSPTETEAAAAAPSLKPSETAGVVIGSTTGVLLAIVAAIFVIRRYHALKHNNDGSGPYPEMAYLYDPFPDHSEGDSGRDEASTLLSGGTGVRPSASSRSITLPRAPHNSLDDEYHHTYNVNTIRYSDPGNPFTDANDPFLDWRSSRVISTPTDTASALAAAVTGYSKGPQKPLPPLPTTHCTLSDHIIPSPTLTPLPPDCSLRRSPAISARNSVNSLRSLRRLHRLNPPSPPSLAPAHPTKPQRNRTLPLTTNDLPLPVDTRSETPHSITLYANPSSYHLLPNAFSYTSSTEDEEDTAAEQEMSHTSRSEMSFSSTTTITGSAVADEGVEVPYTDFPTPPLRRLEQGVAMGDGSMEGLVGSPLVVSPRSYRFLGKG